MDRKVFHGAMALKGDGQTGEFRAVFATLAIEDHDGDVTLPGAFQDGEPARIAHWNHDWDELPVGKGVIHEDGKEAWLEGAFFLDTATGKEHYLTVKNLGDLQEWSYSFDIVDYANGDWKGHQVRFLKKLIVSEVSPVMRGAGVHTRTLEIKGEGAKPYANEHACRLREPGDFQADSFVRTTRKHDGRQYSVIQARLKGEDTLTDQAYRYPKDGWTAAQAKEHCKQKGGRFEAATGKAQKSLNLSRLVEGVRAAFETEFNPKGSEYSEWAYIKEMYDDYLLVDWKSEIYQVNYRLDEGGGYTFPPRAEWVKGALIFVAGAKVARPPYEVKVGARHSGKDSEMLQDIHDMAVALGAKCAEGDDDDSASEGEGDAEGDAEGKARKGKPSSDTPSGDTPSTLAARVALELLGVDAGG